MFPSTEAFVSLHITLLAPVEFFRAPNVPYNPYPEKAKQKLEALSFSKFSQVTC